MGIRVELLSNYQKNIKMQYLPKLASIAFCLFKWLGQNAESIKNIKKSIYIRIDF